MSKTHHHSSSKNRTRDRVWIVLASDGRHVLLGRHSDPTEEELQQAGAAIAAQGLAGWLAVREGDYYRKQAKVMLLKVRSLTPTEGDWDAAVRAFEENRQRYLASVEC